MAFDYTCENGASVRLNVRAESVESVRVWHEPTADAHRDDEFKCGSPAFKTESSEL